MDDHNISKEGQNGSVILSLAVALFRCAEAWGETGFVALNRDMY